MPIPRSCKPHELRTLSSLTGQFTKESLSKRHKKPEWRTNGKPSGTLAGRRRGYRATRRQTSRGAEIRAPQERISFTEAVPTDLDLEAFVRSEDVPTLGLETIVLRTGRPVLAVSNNEPQLVFNEVESEVEGAPHQGTRRNHSGGACGREDRENP